MKRLYTIGYTQKTAEKFFNLIDEFKIKKVLDVRLRNNSQLAGFAKKENLKYFLEKICHCDYMHTTYLAPSEDLFDDYMKKKIDWDEYERQFKKLIIERKIEQTISPMDIDGICLLCCEKEQTYCHRRLVAEHFQNYYNDIKIVHIIL